MYMYVSNWSFVDDDKNPSWVILNKHVLFGIWNVKKWSTSKIHYK